MRLKGSSVSGPIRGLPAPSRSTLTPSEDSFIIDLQEQAVSISSGTVNNLEPTIEQQEQEGEFLDMQTISLFDFGSGGGGIYGDSRDATLNNWRFIEHGFTKLSRDRSTVEKEYPPSCMLAVDIYADRTDEDSDDYPESATQYWPVGQLPLSRLIELGWASKLAPADMQWRQKDPGGYRPSADGENGAESGGFVVADGKTEIRPGAPYSQLFGELKALLGNTPGGEQFRDRGQALGVAAFNGMRAHLSIKALPKSNRVLDLERLTGQQEQAKTIIVPVSILTLPWMGEPGQPAAAATKPAAKRAAKPAVAGPATPTAVFAPDSAMSDADIEAGKADDLVAGYVQQVIIDAGGKIKRELMPSKLIAITAKEGSRRTPIMRRANNEAFLKEFAGTLWHYDAATGTLS